MDSLSDISWKSVCLPVRVKSENEIDFGKVFL